MISKWCRPNYWCLWTLAFMPERTDTRKLILTLQKRGYDVLGEGRPQVHKSVEA